jgi:hypothetical protein
MSKHFIFNLVAAVCIITLFSISLIGAIDRQNEKISNLDDRVTFMENRNAQYE